MPTLAISKLYADGEVFFEAHLDAFRESIEDFVNTTKIDGDNIQDNAIGTDQLAAQAVVATNYADNSITSAKLSAFDYETSSDGALFSTASLSYVALPGGSVTVVSAGRPVILRALPDSGAVGNRIETVPKFVDADGETYVAFFRDSTQIGTIYGLDSVASLALLHVDKPVAGTYVYTIRVKASATEINCPVLNLSGFEVP